MRVVHNHNPVEHFVVCVIGEPGSREFFIRIISTFEETIISLEKEQVIALVERLEEMLRELRRRKIFPSTPSLMLSEKPRSEIEGLSFPVEENFRAGLMGISWLSEEERISIEIQEYSSDPDYSELIPIGEEVADEYAPEIAGATLTLEQVKRFNFEAMEIVNSGRQPCPFCGLPIDPNGHLCPRSNGYKR